MLTRCHHIARAVVLALSLGSFVPVTDAAADALGKVGAANPDATGTPPGGETRTLVVGAGVVYRESIRTTAQGSAQILFPDSSTLNIGRNSNVTIDEYVYDPATRQGNMLASLGKGALRFVGGQISHATGVTVTTPVATIGIRGGVATIIYPIPARLAGADPNLTGCSGELVVGHVGQITLKNASGQVTVRPGFAACVGSPNGPIGVPFRISDAALAIIVASMTSGPGQTGGTPTQPAGPFVTLNNVGTVILDDPAHPPGADTLGFSSIFDVGNGIARSVAGSNQINNGLPPPPPPNPPSLGTTPSTNLQ
jgi:hypothetical protein